MCSALPRQLGRGPLAAMWPARYRSSVTNYSQRNILSNDHQTFLTFYATQLAVPASADTPEGALNPKVCRLHLWQSHASAWHEVCGWYPCGTGPGNCLQEFIPLKIINKEKLTHDTYKYRWGSSAHLHITCLSDLC